MPERQGGPCPGCGNQATAARGVLRQLRTPAAAHSSRRRAASVPVLASALYWGVYVIAIVVALPCALALLFGIVQTARWFLRGGVNHLPGTAYEHDSGRESARHGLPKRLQVTQGQTHDYRRRSRPQGLPHPAAPGPRPAAGLPRQRRDHPEAARRYRRAGQLLRELQRQHPPWHVHDRGRGDGCARRGSRQGRALHQVARRRARASSSRATPRRR